jgi:hypothetical protein
LSNSRHREKRRKYEEEYSHPTDPRVSHVSLVCARAGLLAERPSLIEIRTKSGKVPPIEFLPSDGPSSLIVVTASSHTIRVLGDDYFLVRSQGILWPQPGAASSCLSASAERGSCKQLMAR